jgi:hypothetical protein
MKGGKLRKRKEKKIRRGYDYQDKPRLREDIVYAT